MHCTAVRQRLVAWQDDELSPGENTRVSEHLRRCVACRTREHALRRVTPHAPMVLPPEIEARLHERTEVDRILAAARDPNRNRYPEPPRWQRWMRRDVEVPRWAAMAAAALLATALGWAWQTQVNLDHARAELAVRTATTTQPAITPTEPLPAEHYRPASWQGADDGSYR